MSSSKSDILFPKQKSKDKSEINFCVQYMCNMGFVLSYKYIYIKLYLHLGVLVDFSRYEQDKITLSCRK